MRSLSLYLCAWVLSCSCVQAQRVTIPAGAGTAPVAQMRVIDNTIAQKRERSFGVALEAGHDYTVGVPHAHSHSIIDDDMPRVDFLDGPPQGAAYDDERLVYITITGATSADYPITIDARVDGAGESAYEVVPVHIPAYEAFEDSYLIARIFPERRRTDHGVTVALITSEEDVIGGEQTFDYTVVGDAPRCGCHQGGMGEAIVAYIRTLFSTLRDAIQPTGEKT